MNLNKTQSNFTNIKIGLVLIALLSLSLLSPNSRAQSVQPMVFELEPIGSKSSQSLRIENPNSGPMTVEIVPFKMIVDEYGKESNIPADEDFLIYPPQTIIQADSAQVVKVKYIGDPTIDKSQAYRISVNQLPVDLNRDGSGVSILTKFLTIANVSPAKSRPDLKVTNVAADEDGQWLVTIENDGNRFGSLSSTSWELESSSGIANTKTLSVNEVGEFLTQTLAPPKSKLFVSIPSVAGFSPQTTSIKLIKEN